MKLLPFALIPISLALVACSSGGGSSSSNNQELLNVPPLSSQGNKTNQTQQPSQPTPSEQTPQVDETTQSNEAAQPTQPTQPTQPEKPAVLTGAEVKKALADTFKADGNNLAGSVVNFNQNSVKASLPASSELETLIIDGKEIALFNDEEKKNVDNSRQLKALPGQKGYVGSYASYIAGSGKLTMHADYKNLRYGVYTDEGSSHLFVQGNLTEEGKLPERYVYTYTGNAVYGKDGNYQPLSAQATANFNAKKIKVELSENGAVQPKLVFGGDINGVRFAGESKSGIVAEGAFFGLRGRDVGGVFYQTQGDEQGYNGAFGASTPKQSKTEDTTIGSDY